MPRLYGLGFQYLQPELKYSTYSWVTPVSGKIYALNDPLQNAIPIPAGSQFYFQQSGDYGDLYIKVNSASIPLHNRNFMFLTDEYDWSEDEIADFASFMLESTLRFFTNYWSPVLLINEKTSFNFQNAHYGSSSPNVEIYFYQYNKTSKNWDTCTIYGVSAEGDISGGSLSVYYGSTNAVRIAARSVMLSQPLRIVTTDTYDFITLMFRPNQLAAEVVAEDVYHDIYESFTELLYVQEPVTPVAPNLYMQLEKNYNCPCKDNMNLVIEYDETTSNRLDVYKDGELIKTIEVGNAES